MKNTLRALISILIAFTLLSSSVFALADHRYETYVTQLKEFGIIEAEELDIKAQITQVQFLEYVLKGSPHFDEEAAIPKPAERFKNVPNIMPYAPYVYTALEAGIIEMTEGQVFDPKKKIGRIEGLKMIFDLYGIAAPKLLKLNNEFTDIPANAWYIPYIGQALNLKLIDPRTPDIFGVNDNLTVQEVARIIVEANTVLENQAQPKEIYVGQPDIENIETFYDVYDKINEHYFYDEEIDENTLMHEAISGMVNSLGDRYSVFNTPENTESFMSHNAGEFEGVGMWIERDGDYISVAGVVPDSPAEEKNMKVGDTILKINGMDIKGWSPQKVANSIKGPAGSEVTLYIEKHPDGRKMNVTLKRKKIDLKFVHGEVMDKYYAYFDISQFPQDLSRDFDSIASEIITSRTKGIILDLRNNPGGYISAAEDLLGYFLEQGDTMYYLDYRSNDQVARTRRDGKYAGQYPVVVLIDYSSASASEIVAAALQDHDRATVIGSKSFGKGVAQQLFFYDDGSSLKLTIAEWLSPRKKRLNKEGITPDISIVDNENTQVDEVIKKALRHLKNGR